MTNKINYVDICCGLSWGDEAKGKIVSYLAKTGNYNFVCRWAGGNNAGHTIYKNGIKYKTHLIPSGIFYNICSVIGPDCVINKESFFEEVNYLKKNGFNTDLILISPNAHVITDIHIKEDIDKLHNSQGTTGKGIAPCYKDKYARKGILAKSVKEFEQYLWDEKLYGNILCEGAQGYWLDIIKGNYPYVTSSNTLPYSACSLGFPPQLIRNIYGAGKIYDTRVGYDPDFPDSLLNDNDLKKLGEIGDNPDEKIELKMFHAEILNDSVAMNKEMATFKTIPQVYDITDQEIMDNYFQVKYDVRSILDKELSILIRKHKERTNQS